MAWKGFVGVLLRLGSRRVVVVVVAASIYVGVKSCGGRGG
jgi:hypothetical protein